MKHISPDMWNVIISNLHARDCISLMTVNKFLNNLVHKELIKKEFPIPRLVLKSILNKRYINCSLYSISDIEDFFKKSLRFDMILKDKLYKYNIIKNLCKYLWKGEIFHNKIIYKYSDILDDYFQHIRIKVFYMYNVKKIELIKKYPFLLKYNNMKDLLELNYGNNIIYKYRIKNIPNHIKQMFNNVDNKYQFALDMWNFVNIYVQPRKNIDNIIYKYKI